MLLTYIHYSNSVRSSLIKINRVVKLPPNTGHWSSGKAFASIAGGLRFKSRGGQIGHKIANGSLPLRHFFEKSCVARRCNDAEMVPINSLHALVLQRI